MKILVLSDSHSALRFMRQCVEKLAPDTVIHLGDHYDDAEALEEEYPTLRHIRVPGNCDRYRCPPFVREAVCEKVGGAYLFLTHGHIHRVKSGIGALLADARKCRAQAALYGHTHVADCHREEDGLWVLNPGSCGYGGGSAGIIEITDQKISACYLVKQTDLEEIV